MTTATTTPESSPPLLPCNAETILPHRAPMLFLEQLTARDATSATATAILSEKSIAFSPEHGILPEYFIELIAQTVAAANGYDNLAGNGSVRNGVIVGIDSFSILQEALPVKIPPDGERLFITTTTQDTINGLSVVKGTVFLEAGEIATAELRVYEQQTTENILSEKAQPDALPANHLLPLEDALADCVGKISKTTDARGEIQLEATACFPQDFIAFTGHFPDMPILPAIVQLALVRHTAGHHFRTPLVTVKMRRTKFRAMIAPGEQITLTLKMNQPDREALRTEGSFKLCTEDGSPISAGKFRMQKRGE